MGSSLDFFGNSKIQSTLDWMRERLIFAWIDDENDNSVILKPVENEMHHIVRTNVFGIGNMKNSTPKKDVTIPVNTPIFNSINWTDNIPLKEWLIEVNGNIPK